VAEPRFARPRRAVIKVGSNALRTDAGLLDRDQVRRVAAALVAARDGGTEVVLVSSGAVAAGLAPLGLDDRPADLVTLQSAASVGQVELVHEYQGHLAAHGIAGGQVLLTQDDFVRRTRYLNARATFQRLLELDAVPVVNENDVVATDELAYGDNDRLAALVATMLDAQLLVLLSDVPGLYDADPRTDPDAALIPRVDDPTAIDPAILGGVGSYVGSGGMRSKVDAAHVAVLSACHAVIAHAAEPDVVARVLAGDEVGTWFVAQPRRYEARRLWIGFALTTHGRLHVDPGAAEALRTRGVSLLSVGISRVEGSFVAGDAVEVVDPNGVVLARGLVNYDAAELPPLLGRSTRELARELGAEYEREVVHRDDLVVLHQT
jgi:glutamate 5-kinase